MRMAMIQIWIDISMNNNIWNQKDIIRIISQDKKSDLENIIITVIILRKQKMKKLQIMEIIELYMAETLILITEFLEVILHKIEVVMDIQHMVVAVMILLQKASLNINQLTRRKSRVHQKKSLIILIQSMQNMPITQNQLKNNNQKLKKILIQLRMRTLTKSYKKELIDLIT